MSYELIKTTYGFLETTADIILALKYVFVYKYVITNVIMFY